MYIGNISDIVEDFVTLLAANGYFFMHITLSNNLLINSTSFLDCHYAHAKRERGGEKEKGKRMIYRRDSQYETHNTK